MTPYAWCPIALTLAVQVLTGVFVCLTVLLWEALPLAIVFFFLI